MYKCVSACCAHIKQTVDGYDFYFGRHPSGVYNNLDNSTIQIVYRLVDTPISNLIYSTLILVIMREKSA